MSADPIYDGVKDGFGIYTYCKNNPLIYHDLNGLETSSIWIPQKREFNKDVTVIPTKTESVTSNSLPSGQTKIEPTRFRQRAFDFLNGKKIGGKTFNFIFDGHNTLCNATSMINEMSEEYTKIKGKALTFNQAVDMLKAAMIGGGLKDGTAYEGFFNDAWKITGLGGTWKRDDSNSNHEIYLTVGLYGTIPHFVSSGSSGNLSETGKVFDPVPGNEITLSDSIDIKEIRNYEYTKE